MTSCACAPFEDHRAQQHSHQHHDNTADQQHALSVRRSNSKEKQALSATKTERTSAGGGADGADEDVTLGLDHALVTASGKQPKGISSLGPAHPGGAMRGFDQPSNFGDRLTGYGGQADDVAVTHMQLYEPGLPPSSDVTALHL